MKLACYCIIVKKGFWGCLLLSHNLSLLIQLLCDTIVNSQDHGLWGPISLHLNPDSFLYQVCNLNQVT